jgi:hypothetical protein
LKARGVLFFEKMRAYRREDRVIGRRHIVSVGLLACAVGMGHSRAVVGAEDTNVACLADGGASTSRADGAALDSLSDVRRSDDVFSTLSANAWLSPCREYRGQPDQCVRIELRADGSFVWSTRSSDIISKKTGGWNFRLGEEGSGILLFSGWGVARFSLRDGELSLTGVRAGTLRAGERLEGIGTRASLPEVATPTIQRDLVAGPWYKANELHTPDLPDQVDFGDDGTARLLYRGGGCRFSSTWSVFRTGDHWALLWGVLNQPAQDRCELSDVASVPYTLQSPVSFAEGYLELHGQPYSRELSSEQHVILRGRGLRASATMHGRLIAGRTTEIDIEFTSTRPKPMRVTGFVLSVQPLARSGDGYALTGTSEVLVQQQFEDEVLKPGDAFAVRLSITPTTPEPWTQLRFELRGDKTTKWNVITTVHEVSASAS